MPPDESEFFDSDRGHYEHLRQQREAREDAEIQQRAQNSGCGLLWLLPAGLALFAVVAVDDVVASYPSWSEGIVSLLPGDWVQAASDHLWASAVLAIGVITPLWLLAWAVAGVRRQVAVRMARGWLLGPVRWLWLMVTTTVRALLTLGGLVTAWQVVRLVRDYPLQDVSDRLGPAGFALIFVGAASALRAFALHRQLPDTSQRGW